MARWNREPKVLIELAYLDKEKKLLIRSYLRIQLTLFLHSRE